MASSSTSCGAVFPCKNCGMSERNTIHKNSEQFGYHKFVVPAEERVIDDRLALEAEFRAAALVVNEMIPHVDAIVYIKRPFTNSVAQLPVYACKFCGESAERPNPVHHREDCLYILALEARRKLLALDARLKEMGK